MHILYTESFAKALNLPDKLPNAPKGAKGAKGDPLFSWCALAIDGRGKDGDMVIMSNDAYPIVVGFPAPEGGEGGLERLMERFRLTLRRGLELQDVPEEIVNQYLQEAGELVLVPNANEKEERSLSRFANDMIHGKKRLYLIPKAKGPGADKTAPLHCSPNDEFIGALSRYGHVDKRTPSVELECRLRLVGYSAIRRLMVPYYINFDDLHHIIHSAYGWGDDHLYSFDFYLGQNKGWNGDITLFSDRADQGECRHLKEKDDIFDIVGMEGRLVLRADEIMLNKLIPPIGRFVYRWDFGDGWEHEITVKEFHSNPKGPIPDLISGSGDSALDDIGGPWGFERFKEIMADPEHEEYEDLKEWAEEWSPFDFDSVKFHVRHAYFPSWRKNKG
jgi:hypothetical protein